MNFMMNADGRAKTIKIQRKKGNGKTVLVAGGAGFVGTHLCRQLLSQNKEVSQVVCVDNLMTGRMSNIQPFMGNEKFQFHRQDIIEPLLVDGRVDEIYNLACPASPPHYQLDPVHTMQTCILGSINLLRLARDKSARILQASTSEVYGNPQVHPQPENYKGNVNTVGPRSCYDEGKRCAETLFHDYAERDGLTVKIARIFNTYGPFMSPDDGRVVSNFVCQALQGKPITIYGNGMQTRSFCYVDDLVAGLMVLMASPADVQGPINLGNPGEFTVRELADMVIELTGSRSDIVHRPLPKDDPVLRRPDISKARALLSWCPKEPLKSGLKKTIAHFDQELNEGSLIKELV